MSNDRNARSTEIVDTASALIHDFELRRHTHERLVSIGVLDDTNVAAIGVTGGHLMTTLLMFTPNGDLLRTEQLEQDSLLPEPIQPVAEFDIGFTGLVVPADSELDRLTRTAHTWIADAAALRKYDPAADKQSTSRRLLLEALASALAAGDLRLGPGLDQRS